jgi:hypothetical protein
MQCLLRPSQVVFYTDTRGLSKKRTQESKANSLANLKHSRTKTFSKKAQKRCISACEKLISIETFGRFGKNSHLFRYASITFVTLTLPVINSKLNDFELKRRLNKFLIYLERQIGRFEYVWKAERQKNGNLHFHLLINRKIHWQIIRSNWNICISELVKEYSEKMKKLSLSDYIEIRKKEKNFDLKKCVKAYHKAVKEGWTNPNTTDIHSIYLLKNIISYVSKYISKNENNIKGRYWGCSDFLRSFEVSEKVVLTKKDFEIIEKNAKIAVKRKHFEIYYFNFYVYLLKLSCICFILQKLRCLYLLKFEIKRL